MAAHFYLHVATLFNTKPAKRKVVRKLLAICLLLSILVCSCNHAGNKLAPSTPYFDSVIARSERMYDAGDKLGALHYARTKHNEGNGLTVEDEMNYYAYISALVSRDFNDHEKSAELADTMLTILDKAGTDTKVTIRKIQALNIKADALYSKGLYNEAFKTYFNAKVLASTTEDPCAVSMFSYHMGMILYRQQKFTEASVYFKQSYSEMLSCVENFTYFYRKQELLDNIGLCYQKVGKFDSALIYYNKSLAYVRANYNKFPNKAQSVYETAEAVIYGNVADVFIGKGQLDTAIQMLNKSITVNLQMGYANTDAETDQVKLAEIYLKGDKLDELNRLLIYIRAELDTIPNKVVEIQCNNLMYRFCNRKNDSLLACRYAVAYIKLNDSFQAGNKLLMASDIEATVRAMEKQHQLSLLEKDKEKRDIYLVIAAVVALMAVIVILMVMRNSSRAERDLKMLKDLNLEIGDRKRQLEDVLYELEVRDKDKSRILRSVAHDVMSPISAISALTDILLTEGKDLNAEQWEMLDLIQEACGNSLSLSNEILDAADTIDPGTMVKERVDINKLVHSSVELLNAKAATKKQVITIEQETPGIFAMVNKGKIRRVLENLMGNAIKFSYENSSIQLSLTQAEGKVLITVKDSGIGIANKGSEHIFDMFTESKTYGTKGEKPHGIGLSIALQVARAHGGDIWFESEEGKGTTFYLSLPLNF